MTARVIVITGASSGIGAATAKILAGRGEIVILAARRLVELKQVAELCGKDAPPVVTDVTRRAAIAYQERAARVAAQRLVLGHPLAHSLSPEIHAFLLEQVGEKGSYELFDTLPEGLGEAVGRLCHHLVATALATWPNEVPDDAE